MDTSSPGHQGTTDEPLMRSRRHTKIAGITIPSACNSKVYGAPSTELHYMGYYPLTAFDFYATATVYA